MADINVIGYNYWGQLGLGHEKKVLQLAAQKSFEKTKIHEMCIYFAKSTTIFAEKEGKYWSAGRNANGECAIDVHKEYLNECQRIEYFDDHNIKINKICTNVSGQSIFWITANNKLYGNGMNNWYQLGFANNYNKYNKPYLVEDIKNVIDVSLGEYCSIALCESSVSVSDIIKYWSDINKIMIPNDVYSIIHLFYDCYNEVYSTRCNINGCNGQKEENSKNNWNKLDIFNDKQIISIKCGSYHSVFVESNGRLWVCGENNYGQLGREQTNWYGVYTPDIIHDLWDWNIKIIKIDCGLFHTLALDEDGMVHSWGSNKYGQCGRNNNNNNNDDKIIWSPTEIYIASSLKIIDIKCGANHSCIMSEHGKYLMFGKNNCNQCIVSTPSKITKPTCINQTFEEIKNGYIIKDIYLGFDNTIIIASKI